MKAIVCSEKDPAGLNIRDRLLEKGFNDTRGKWQGKTVHREGEWLLVETESQLINAEEIGGLDAEEIIFISKHSSQSGKPTLTTHVPGNFGPADYGGSPGELCQVPARRMREVYLNLINPPSDYNVSLEVTHHGPSIPQPCFFVELGSTEKQWGDSEVGGYVAEAVISAVGQEPEQVETAIGIGGNHYAPKFSEKEKEVAFGHIIPKYSQDNLDIAMVDQMMEKTVPRPSKIYMDRRGTRGQSEVREMLSDYNLELL